MVATGRLTKARAFNKSRVLSWRAPPPSSLHPSPRGGHLVRWCRMGVVCLCLAPSCGSSPLTLRASGALTTPPAQRSSVLPAKKERVTGTDRLWAGPRCVDALMQGLNPTQL